MARSGRPLLPLVSLVPESRLLEAARSLVGLGAFTQADMGVVACRGATSKASRGVLAQRLRRRMEAAKWIEPYTAPDPSGLRRASTREGARVYRLTHVARQELARSLHNDEGPRAAYTEHINVALAECPPPEQLPRKGVLLANRWLYANALRHDGVDGARYLAIGEYALRGELRFANPLPGRSGYETGKWVDRMPDGLLLKLRHEVRPRVGPVVTLEELTVVEIERRFEDAAKHFRLFLHFDANGELRPVASALFEGLGPATQTTLTGDAIAHPTRIQVVRAVERPTAPPRRHKNAWATSGEAVTANYLLELAKVFFFGAPLVPPALRSQRTDELADELHRSGALARRAFSTAPAEASLARFRWMLRKIEVVTVEVHGRHGTLTDACVCANGALRAAVHPVTLCDVLDAAHPALRAALPSTQSPTPQAPMTSPEPARSATAGDLSDEHLAMVRRIVRSQVSKVARAGLDGSEMWRVLSSADLDALADRLGPIMAQEGEHGIRQPAAACAAHAWLTGSEEAPSHASVEVGSRCVYVFDLDTGRIAA